MNRFQLLDLIAGFSSQLGRMLDLYGEWVYPLLFLIVFCETGLVIAPFLPGDSLLLAAGALAAVGMLEINLLVSLLFIAAVAGNAVNYAVGRLVGDRALGYRLVNRTHLDRSRAFYERHGGKAVMMARFVPFARTFAPFIAGMSRMDYGRFVTYSVVGALLWVGLLVGAGYVIGEAGFF